MDAIVVGGGLAGGLLAYRLSSMGSVLLLDRAERLGGNHTWCLHETDLDPDTSSWLLPLFSQSWSGHEVRFPKFTRALKGGYHALRSEDLNRHVQEKLRDRVLLGQDVEIVSDTEVRRDGAPLEARVVFDARGYRGSVPSGYQKFLGQDWVMDEPHGVDRPILMDATCPQWEGYRFIYVLPWDERRLLVEDTRYSDTPAVDEPGSRQAIQAYVTERWGAGRMEREEVGSLPIPLVEEPWHRGPGVGIGMAGALYHPTTGYSFPRLVQTIRRVVEGGDFDPSAIRRRVGRVRRSQPEGYFCFLNRMLFRGATGDQRRQIFQRFYRLGEKRIARFYRGDFNWVDRARLLVGKPPIPVTRAWESMRASGVRAQEASS